MMRFSILIILFLTHFSILLGQNKTKTMIYFGTKISILDIVAQNQLDKLVDSLSEKNIKIILKGHTDNQGKKNENVLLSEKRALEVKKYLVKKNIKENCFEILTLGDEKPIVNNNNPTTRGKNRRVEIEVIEIIQDIPIHQKENINTKKYNFTDLYTKIEEKNTQIFNINNQKDTLLYTKNGMIVYIKANTFKINTSHLEITITENLTKSSIILNRLSTHSDDKILASQGMFSIEAKDSSNNILDAQQKITYFFPVNKYLKESKIFDGVITDDKLNWKANTESITNVPLINILASNFVMNCKFNSNYHCPFFFCKIKFFFRSIFKKNLTIINNAIDPNNIFASQLYFNEWNEIPEKVINIYENLNTLSQKYGINDPKLLFQLLNKPILDKYGAKNENELRAKIKSIRLQNLEANYRGGTIKAKEFSYYIFQNDNIGLHNVDIFVNIPQKDRITLRIENDKMNDYTDCKLVFKKQNIVLNYSKINDKYFEFISIPKNEEMWIIGLKYENNQPFLSMELVNSNQKKYTLRFENLSLEDLKDKLKVMNN